MGYFRINQRPEEKIMAVFYPKLDSPPMILNKYNQKKVKEICEILNY